MSLNIRRNVSTNVVAFFINIALTFIGYRMVVQQGGTAALGVWSALSAAIFVIRLGDVGMGSSAERHVAMVDATAQPLKARGYLDTALIINSLLFLILACIGWLVLSFKIEWVVPDNQNLQLEALHLLPLMLVVFVISNIANVLSGGLRGLHLVYITAYLSIGGAILQLLVILILVPRLGIAGLAWAQLAQNIFIAILAWYYFNKKLKSSLSLVSWLPTQYQKLYFRELFSFSMRSQVVNLINGLFEPISKFLVGHSSGMATLGIFEIAYKIVSLPRNAVVSGVMGITPAITKLLLTEKMEAIRLYRKAKKIVIIATGAVLLCVVLTSPVMSYLLLHKIDSTLIIFISILAVGFWFNDIGAPAYTLGFAFGKMKSNMISASMSVVSLVLFGLLTQVWSSLYGAVVACGLSLMLGGFFILFLNEKLLKDAS